MRRTKKVLAIRAVDGRIFHVPLDVIAKDRADYYATKGEKDFNHEEEMQHVLEDDFEGIDWFQNNMNLEDVQASAICVAKPLFGAFKNIKVEEIVIRELEAKPETDAETALRIAAAFSPAAFDSEHAVEAIVADLTDRRGLKWAWNEIDTDTQEEIKTTWRAIIDGALARR